MSCLTMQLLDMSGFIIMLNVLQSVRWDLYQSGRKGMTFFELAKETSQLIFLNIFWTESYKALKEFS